jgi:tRNA (cmo5U34)-methyltransferase
MSEPMTTSFSFAKRSKTFDRHIEQSIPGYGALIETSLGLSRRFVQDGTTVVDIGCSTGSLISQIETQCYGSRFDVRYVGLDIEPRFRRHWVKSEIEYRVADARTFDFNDTSLACSMFTLQFIRPPEKRDLLRRIHDGLVEGGALLIAEKILASTARLQDAMTFPYYDFKIEQGFRSKEILDKERSLRGQMTLWSRKELENELQLAGFREIEAIWEHFPFVALIALK